MASAEEALLAYKQAHPLFAAFYDKAASIIARHADKLTPVVDLYKKADAYLDKKLGQGIGKLKEFFEAKGASTSKTSIERSGGFHAPLQQHNSLSDK